VIIFNVLQQGRTAVRKRILCGNSGKYYIKSADLQINLVLQDYFSEKEFATNCEERFAPHRVNCLDNVK
jgi:hypothetical protein